LFEKILAEIDAEIARLRKARAMLTTMAKPAKRGPGRPAKTSDAIAPKKPKKRTMSAEAREKIRQAQLKRWAATRKSAKSSTK
jgi:hypothetical protein